MTAPTQTQTETHDRVSRHYSPGDLASRILAALEADGRDLGSLTVDDLAPVDEFHIRGRVATEELAGWVDLKPTDEVLDVGSGLGGTGRYLASRFGCCVQGVDLTEEYCRVATMLSERVGLHDKTSFRAADACALPFEDDSFDIVWTEHVQMNIADKAAFYGEIGRVLRPGGRFVFHDVFAGTNGAAHYPVPWASDESISHLATVPEVESILGSLGLRRVQWGERTEESRAFFQGVLERLGSGQAPALGIHLPMGVDALVKVRNLHRNLVEGCVRVIQAVVTNGI